MLRFAKHITMCASGKMDCPKLYDNVLKYGYHNFAIEVVKWIHEGEEIKSVEQQYCEWLKPSLNSLWGTKHTKDSIDKMRKSQREYWSKNSHPRKGVPFTEEHKKNLSKSMGKKCYVDGVIYESVKECATILGIHRDTVSWRMRSKSFTNYYYL
jgi:hypothetical protein